MSDRKSSSPLGPDADRARIDIRLPSAFRDAIGKSSQCMGIPVGTFLTIAAARMIADIQIAGVTDAEVLEFVEKQFQEVMERIRARAIRRATAPRRRSSQAIACE